MQTNQQLAEVNVNIVSNNSTDVIDWCRCAGSSSSSAWWLFWRHMPLRRSVWYEGWQGSLCVSLRLQVEHWTCGLWYWRTTIQVHLSSNTSSLPPPTTHSTVLRRPMLTLL